uniref:Metallophosphoesterase n=1 Tax=Clandestinovirus TaxID=2831644 RepID=A0A8F8PJZ8_9VIRU|nr:metallophosphoesterase [Clandestinovirus]
MEADIDTRNWTPVLDFQFVSDLHLEFYDCTHSKKWPKVPALASLLIIAGDLGRVNQPQYFAFLKDVSARFRHVILVPGNHEYYQAHKPTHTINDVDELLKDMETSLPNVHLLNRKSVIIDNVKFIGATLWTGCPPEHRQTVQSGLNDYQLIYKDKGTGDDVTRRDWKKVTVDDTVDRHRYDLAFIKDEINNATLPTVVITHHCPTREHIALKYRNEGALNHGYHTPLEDNPEFVFKKPVVAWINGHSHSACNFTKTFDGHQVLFLMNCRGYPHEVVEGYSAERIGIIYKSDTDEFKAEETVSNDEIDDL